MKSVSAKHAYLLSVVITMRHRSTVCLLAVLFVLLPSACHRARNQARETREPPPGWVLGKGGTCRFAKTDPNGGVFWASYCALDQHAPSDFSLLYPKYTVNRDEYLFGGWNEKELDQVGRMVCQKTGGAFRKQESMSLLHYLTVDMALYAYVEYVDANLKPARLSDVQEPLIVLKSVVCTY